MTRLEMIERNAQDAIYYSSIGNKSASDFFVEQAVLLCNNNHVLIDSLRALIIVGVVNSVLNK